MKLCAIGVRDDDGVFLGKAEAFVGEREGETPAAVVKVNDGVFLDLWLDGAGGKVRVAEIGEFDVEEEDGLAVVFIGDERWDFRAGELVGECGFAEDFAQAGALRRGKCGRGEGFEIEAFAVGFDAPGFGEVDHGRRTRKEMSSKSSMS